MEQAIDIKRWLGALRRRWLLIVLPVLLLTPLAVLVAYILPPVYKATAHVIVESPQIPTELATSTVTVDVGEQIALIEQRLMTRQNLLDIAARFDVMRDKGQLSPSEITERMRRASVIEGVRLAGARGPITGVTISFTADRAQVAADVANEFLARLLEQNIQQRKSRAQETSDYFRRENARLANEVATLEARITAFKVQNEGALPESLSFRREELARLQQQVFDRELRQLELEQQKKSILDSLQRGDFDVAGREPTPEEKELDRLRTALVQNRATYAPSHPVIRSLEARIAALDEQMKSALAAAAPAADGAAAAPENLSGQVNQMLAAIDNQSARLASRRDDEEARITQLKASIEKTPEVELELGRLEQRLVALQTQYRDSVVKLAQAETGERLEINQQAERFEVIERAQPPERPDSPNRLFVIAAGFVGSAGLGFGLALLLEILNRSIRTASDLERLLDLRPVVSIPYIWTESELRRRAWTRRIAAVLIVVVTPAALYTVDQYYLPLPLLAQKAMTMAGIDNVVAMINTRLQR